MALTPWYAGLTAFVASLLAVPPVARVARALGIVDRPGPLKVQTAPVPYLGGVAVMVGMLAAAWTRVFGREVTIAALLPLGLALGIGIADDARDLPVALRVLGELGIGLALAWAVPCRLGGAGWVPTVLLAVLLMNGVNLLDGLDGVAAGVVIASSAGFAVLLTGAGRIAALTCLGAVAGFLVHNRPPARIYLGDGGSYLLGTGLALLVALSWSSKASTATSVASLLFVALPVAEVAWAVVRRGRAHLPLLAGDRGHSYDRLAGRGWSTLTVAAVLAGMQLALVAVGLAAAHSGSAVAVVVVVVAATGVMVGGAAAGFLAPVGTERLG
ncbi:MAG: glycosyltransferase family 4 protein [Acidimicrobiales bacterium]